MRYETEIDLDIEGILLNTRVVYTAEDFLPAITHLAPEDCHPPEGGDIEIIELEIAGADMRELLDNKQLYNTILDKLTTH